MTIYNTKNPIGSPSLKDINDNAITLDNLVNSTENTTKDRFGNDRLTIKGLEEAAVSAGPTVEAAAKALEQANEAKKNSDAIKADTENYIRRAETAADASKSAASNSEASAIRSESAAAKAESVADAAGTYPDISTGLAATEAGQYFRVPQGDGSNVSFAYYRNNAGVAEKVTEQPSAQYVEKVRIESTMPQGRLLAAISAALSLIDDLAGDGDSKLKEVAEKLSQISESISKNGDAIQGISVAVSILTEAMTLLKSRHEAENEKMSVMTSLSMLIESLAPLDGFDPQNIIAGTGANVQKFEGAYIAKAPSAVVRIDIETDSNIPSSKEDGKVKCRCKINIDGVEFSAYSTMAVQGSSAVYFPKKNLTLAFFKDENYDKSVELKIGDGLPHDEWVYKANYVDSTHLRNLFGYRFWERIRDSRNTWPQREIDFYYEGKTGFDAIDTGATGLPKGYPCVLYVNNSFYGIGDITIGKKRKNYNMAKDKPNNIYLALNNCDLLTLNVEDESIVEVKTPATITDEFNGYIQDWRDFANLSQTEFTAALPSKLNPLNVIDYYILVQTLCLSDCLNRNVLMQTWDGNKWFFMPYDLKGCLGINPQGNALLDYDFDPVADGAIHQGTKDFWFKVKTALQAEMNSRYKALRDQDIISLSCVAGILNELHSKRTESMFKSEWAKWSGLPSKNISSMSQMMTWFANRITWLDTHFSYTK